MSAYGDLVQVSVPKGEPLTAELRHEVQVRLFRQAVEVVRQVEPGSPVSSVELFERQLGPEDLSYVDEDDYEWMLQLDESVDRYAFGWKVVLG